MTHRILLLLFFTFALAALVYGQSRGGASPDEWRSYGRDPGGARYSPLEQINRTNVSTLRRAWTFHTGEVGAGEENTDRHRIASFEATPLMVDGVLYFSTPGGRVFALQAETGKEIWKFDSQANRHGPRRFLQNRGVAFWEGSQEPAEQGGGCEKTIFYGTFDGHLAALDATTGKLCPEFGDGGLLDLRKGVTDGWPLRAYAMTSPPAVYEDLVITGAMVQEYPSFGPSGAVRAFDARIGKLVWNFNTVPLPGEPGHDTWQGDGWKDRSGTNVWSMMSVDAGRGLVFLPIGSPSYDFYGADRKGAGLYGNSLVALDAATGKLRWHFQFVHHDLWDYDPPAQPVLVTLHRGGREIPAVVQVTKMGFVFVLNRLTGVPIFPVEERPVPPSKVPGEQSWATQPFPLEPPPLADISVTEDDLAAITPELHDYCEKTFGRYLPARIFAPYGPDMTVIVPGNLGGGTWSGSSFDPVTGFLYVNVNNVGQVGMLEPQPPGSPEAFRRSSPWGEYARFWDPNHYPCQKPPWGTLNAVALNSGKIAWKIPLGVVEALRVKGAPLAGALNLGGTIATAGGLVFIGGSNDARFRAFDARTGKVLWETRLEASGHATPMTFLGRNGKQYVVIAAGGGGYFSRTASDTLDAFALP